MSDDAKALIALLFIVGGAVAAMAIGIIGTGCEWSLRILRAQRQRRSMLNERAAELIAMGHKTGDAKDIAEHELSLEAAANQKAIKQVIG